MNDPRFNGVQPVCIYFVMKENIFAVGLRSVLEKLSNFQYRLLGHSARFSHFTNLRLDEPLDILLVSVNRHFEYGMLKSWLKDRPGVSVIGISQGYDQQLWQKARQAGCVACLAMDERVEDFRQQLVHALGGQFVWPAEQTGSPQKGKSQEQWFVETYKLTPREIEVLKLISQAMSTKEIARNLYISDQTVSVHRKNIMRKLGVNNTAAVVRMAVENQLTTDFF